MTDEERAFLRSGRGLRMLIWLITHAAWILVWWKTQSWAWGFICAMVLIVIREAPKACMLDRLDAAKELEEKQTEEARKRERRERKQREKQASGI